MYPIDEDICPSIIHYEDITSENGAMRFTQMPTLQHMAAVKISSQLWTKKDTREKIAELYEDQEYLSLSRYTQMCTAISGEICNLPLPDKSISYLSYIASRLAIEKLQWMNFQKSFDRSFKPELYLHCIQWTSRGRIDGEKTAQTILSMENISGLYKKKASNYYCFNLKGESLMKQALDNCDNQSLSVSSFNETYFLNTNDPIREIQAIQGPAFMRISTSIGESALRRLWVSFTEETRSEILNNLRFYRGNTDFFFFLFSQMDGEIQMSFFRRSHGLITLGLLHDWLWQDFFIPSVLKLFPIMHGRHVENILNQMACKISQDIHNFKNRQLIIELIHIIKMNLAIPSIGQKIRFGIAVYYLFKGRNMDIIILVLSLIPSDKKTELLAWLISTLSCSTQDKTDLLQFIVNQIFESQEEIEEHFLKKNCYFEYINNLIKRRCLEKIEIFIKIFLCDKTKVDTLKRKILLKYLADDFNTLVVKRNYIELRKILSFCFSSDEQNNLEFRTTQIFKRVNPQALTFLVMREGGDLRVMEEFLCFCFGQEDGISIGKSQLLQDRKLLAKMSDELVKFKWPFLIDEFLDWCFAYEVEMKDAFKKEWRKSSNKYCLYEIYRGCYISEDPKKLLKELELSIEDLLKLMRFCHEIKWPAVIDQKWWLINKYIRQEMGCRVENLELYTPDLDSNYDSFDIDSDSDYTDDSDFVLDFVFASHSIVFSIPFLT